MIESDLYEFLWSFNAQDRYPLFLEHIKYGTCELGFKHGKMVAAVRYNISKSGHISYILDLYIKSNGIEMMREFGRSGKRKFPSLKYIKFDREFKDKPRSNLVYKLSSLTKE